MYIHQIIILMVAATMCVCVASVVIGYSVAIALGN